LAVLPVERSRARRAVQGKLASFLSALLPQEAPADGGLRAELEASAPPRRRELLTAAIRQRVAASLALDPTSIDPRRGFFDIGMDSMTALELRDSLVSGLGIDQDALSATTIFDYPSVQELAAHLLAEVLRLDEGAPAGGDDLDRLTEQELVELLATELDSQQLDRS
jgi:acyl carrier protein